METFYQLKIYLPNYGLNFNNVITANFNRFEEVKFLIEKYQKQIPIKYNINIVTKCNITLES